MASFSSHFVGSASSARSNIRDVFESYRRAQYLVAGSNVPSNSETRDYEDQDPEVQGQRKRRPFLEDDDESSSEVESATPFVMTHDDHAVCWDEDFESANQTNLIVPSMSIVSPTGTAREDTPLLANKTSEVSFCKALHRNHTHVLDTGTQSAQVPNYLILTRQMSRTSVRSAKSVNYDFSGQSTYGQTLFNAIAILLGVGMLSEPLAFAYAGWIMGTFLILSYGFVACYTAKVLARIILTDPRIRSYSDIGRKAFGPIATPIISFMFCLELFSVSVVLVTLYGDSLHSLLPQHTSNFYKALGFALLIPSVFLPLSLLSYASILGIASTFLLIFVIFFDGFSKMDAPGSLWQPCSTQFAVQNMSKLGVAFGLFMAGFSGHAVIPSLARDMIDPTQFDHMINWAFIVATCIYAIIGYAGYLMFGHAVHDEISVNLLATPGYNPALNTLCLWLLVVSPISKFGLNTQPLNATIEILLGLDAPLTSPQDLAAKPDGLSVAPKGSHFGRWKRTLGVLQRVLVTTLSISVSIMIPEFGSMMAFIGSFAAFMISIVGPVIAKAAIDGKCSRFDMLIIIVGTIMAIWGTVAAFL